MIKIKDLYDSDLIESYYYIFPLERVSIKQKEVIGNVTLLPKGLVDIDDMFTQTFSLSSEDNEKFKVNIEVFKNNPLVIINDCAYADYLGNVSSDEEIVKKAISKASIIVDYIKFKFCSLVNPRTMPARLGQVSTGQTLLLMYHGKGSPFTRIIDTTIYSNTVTAGKGLEIESEVFTDFPLLKSDINEVGHVACQSLRMYSSALEENDDTGKFIEIMRLFEFIADPLGFTKFKEVRVKIAAHIVENGSDIQRLQEEFKYYSSGDNEDGLRTEIIHNGKSLDTLITNVSERSELFIKLQSYIKICISDLILYYNKRWDELRVIRENKTENAKKIKAKKKKPNYSNTAIIIDGNFLYQSIEKFTPVYSELYPDKKFDCLKIEDVIYEVVRNCRKLEGGKTYRVLFLSDIITDLPLIKIPIGSLGNKALKGNDCFFEFEVYTFDNKKDKNIAIYKVTDDIFVDKNFSDPYQVNYQNVIFFGDSPDYIELLYKVIDRKNRDLTLIKCSHFSEMPHRVPFFDVGHLIGMSFGLHANEL